jgi:hypothetical protein
MLLCKCGHNKNKHDFAITERDEIGKHCLCKGCNCKKFMLIKQRLSNLKERRKELK